MGGWVGGWVGGAFTSSSETPSFFAAAVRAASIVLPTTHRSLCACFVCVGGGGVRRGEKGSFLVGWNRWVGG